ncbi:hypothetical protein BT96DRAFT_493663 [Gymnopus androsaceus JB14]|uniref:F-box domain-containing protein n=1 Tax=Gymnopus androsaceus JB14 TaxID=1447944 RepID=A0A6A4GPM1_9AGAR|nr:hypothetical protein BT96DRAFT_493663 [Gymnopus androsaceus JB14]
MYRGLNAFDSDDFPRKEMTMKEIFAPLEILLGEVARWNDVHLDFTDLPHDTKFPNYPVSVLTMLESFSVRTFQPHPRHTTSLVPNYMKWISSIAESSPSLQKFATYGGGSISHLSGYNSTHSVPWGRLTSLTLERVSEKLALYILQSSSSLVECTFSDMGHYIDWNYDLHHAEPQLRDDIMVNGLEKLSVTAQHDLDVFWTHLIVPNLQELDIYMLPSSRQWHQGEDLVQCLTRSGSVLDAGPVPIPGLATGVPSNTFTRGPPISRLVLRNCNMRSRLGACAMLLSESLREVAVIDQAIVDDTIIKLLTLPDMAEAAPEDDGGDGDGAKTSQMLCPRLEQLTLIRCISASDGLTSQMVRSRWLPSTTNVADAEDEEDNELANAPRKLKFVRIEFSNPQHGEDVYQLEEMYDEGLKGRVGMKRNVELIKRKVVNPIPANVPVLQRPPLWG